MLQKNVGKIIYFLDVTADGWIGVVMQVAFEFFCGAAHGQFIVRINAAPIRRTSAPKPDAVIRIPVAMGDPAAQKPDFAREKGAGQALVGDSVKKLKQG